MSSADRTEVKQQLTAVLSNDNLPSDLSDCVGQRAGELPASDIQALKSSGTNDSAKAKQIGLTLLADCVKSGSGVTYLRAQIINAVKSKLATVAVPGQFVQCFEAKANAITSAQLTQLIDVSVKKGLPAGTAASEQFGAGLAKQCVNQPSVVAATRTQFITSFTKAIAKLKFSTAYKQCALGKLKQTPASTLEELLQPAKAQSVGNKLGLDAGKACIAEGVHP